MPRVLDGGIAEDPSQSFTGHTASLCAMKCQLRQSCQLFRCNTLTTECDLYDGIAFRRNFNVTGNQFFQKMPSSKSVSTCTSNGVASICVKTFFDDDDDDDMMKLFFYKAVFYFLCCVVFELVLLRLCDGSRRMVPRVSNLYLDTNVRLSI